MSLAGFLIGLPVVTVVGIVMAFFWIHGSVSPQYLIVLIVLIVTPVDVAWLIAFLWSRYTAHRDLEAGTFMRWTGPVSTTQAVGGTKKTTHALVMGETTLALQSELGERVSKLGLTTASIDYTTRSHDILEVRNADGVVVYRDKHLEKALARRSPQAAGVVG